MEYVFEVLVDWFDVRIYVFTIIRMLRTGYDDGVGCWVVSGVVSLFGVLFWYEVALEIVYVVVASDSSYVEISTEDLVEWVDGNVVWIW